jgi:hypothetical protein
MTPLPLPVPSRSNTQRRARSHSPVVFDGTPRIPVRERVGQTNSTKRRLQHVPFDFNRLGSKTCHPSVTGFGKGDPRGSCGNWSNWEMTSPWQPWKQNMIPRCEVYNKRIWQPRQEREWNHTHAPEETSNCHPGRAYENEEEDETGGTESTETAEQEGEEEDQN